MDDNTHFSDEGMAFSAIIRETMLLNMAAGMLTESRFEALLEILGSPPSVVSAGESTASDLRELTFQKARVHLDRKLAGLAEDNHALISAVHRMLSDFLPSPPE